MEGIAVDEDSTVRPGGARIFTCSATDAYLVLYLRDKQLALIGNHVACLGGAVLGAGTAGGLFRMYDAVVLNKYGFADLCQFLGLQHQRHDGAGRAYISASCALVVAEAAVEIHPGLHDTGKPVLAD